MALSDFVNVLEQYSGVHPANPPASTAQDFDQVAQGAPQSHLAAGLSEAFHSNQTPPFADMIQQMFSQSNGQQRAGILTQLLGATGMGSVGGLGASLSGLLQGGNREVTPEQAQQVAPEDVHQLAEQAHKNDPSIVDTASQYYAQHPVLVKTLGLSALALIMNHMSSHS